MSKVRRIDWSPSEWLAGTRGLSLEQTAVYITVLNIIYDRGGDCPYDLDFIAGQFKEKRHHRSEAISFMKRVGHALTALVQMGKLQVSADGQGLTNGRAEEELNKARERIHGAIQAGIASGSARKTKRPTSALPRPYLSPTSVPHPSNINDLTRTPVRIINHHYESYLSKNLTVAARDPALNGGSGPRARQPETTKERVAALAAIARAKLLGSA